MRYIYNSFFTKFFLNSLKNTKFFKNINNILNNDKKSLLLNYPFLHNLNLSRDTDYNTHINTNYIENGEGENIFIIVNKINSYNNVVYIHAPWSNYIPLSYANLTSLKNCSLKKIKKINFFNFNLIKEDININCDYFINNTFYKVQTSYKTFFKKFYNFNVLFFAKTEFYKAKYIFKNSNFFKINYNPTDMASNLNSFKLLNFFIRKNKIFNKGRYSRNRQLYRTGVYWCILLNVICVYGLYYYFYRFTFNFGYLYIYFFIFILSIFGSRLIKYRFYNIKNIFKEVIWFIDFYFGICVKFFKKMPYKKYKIIFKKFFFKNV